MTGCICERLKVAEAVRELGRKAIVIEADVSQVEPVRAMVKSVIDESGKIDILEGLATGRMRDVELAMEDK
jgi:NAD(P)-dependent dehydrogenase (short-subunit alcohol dehydrogenase family)